jgi:hypothetical protein
LIISFIKYSSELIMSVHMQMTHVRGNKNVTHIVKDFI